MSDDGFFVINRGIFGHAVFANEPYSEREAWIWLIGAAAWKQTRIRSPRGMITLERGQLMHSERFLAKKWSWSRSRVTRFLFRLETELMVSRQQDHETNRITICNYEEYQLGGATNRTTDKAETEPAANQQRTKEEELKNLRKNNIEGDANASPDKVVPMRRYAFEGRVIRLEQADFNKWRQTYQAIPDIMAVLQTADDYYTQTPPKDGKWFFPVSNWLKKENDAWGEKIRMANARPDRSF